jgi:predicted ATPase
MLSKLILDNFKPIHGRLELPLRRVTVLAGLNSSGKSTIIQSVLLLSQTLANANAERALILNSNTASLGTFPDVLNERATSPHLTLGFTLAMDDYIRRTRVESTRMRRTRYTAVEDAISGIEASATFESATSGGQSAAAIEAVRVALATSRVAVTLDAEHEPWLDADAAKQRTVTASITRLSADEQGKFMSDVKPEFTRLLPYGEGDNHIVTISSEKPGPKKMRYITRLNHFLPDLFIGKYSLPERQLRELGVALDVLLNERASWELPGWTARSRPLFEQVMGHQPTSALLDQIRAIVSSRPTANIPAFKGKTLSDLLTWTRRVPLKTRAKFTFTNQVKQAALADLMLAIYGARPTDAAFGLENMIDDYDTAAIDFATRKLVSYFSTMIRYIGPLRADPQAAQRFAPSNEPDDVGPKGEYAAAVFEANKRLEISWWEPVKRAMTRGALADALDFWVKYLSIAHHVSTREAGPSGVSWVVQHLPDSKERPLNSVGVGVSQVLPILVAGLLAPEGSVVMIEQPELHLHPRAQARIGDFLFGLSALGKQCLVETHSDSLVNQLRLTIVRGGERVRNDIEVYFARQDDHGAARLVPISISPTGAITNWPDGFFDETALQEEAITREGLSVQARKRHRDA